MDDDQLIELYERAKEISNVSWLIRCIIIGIAKGRSTRGDGAVKSIAQTFGIGERMAQIDIQVYDTFVKDNPEFEPLLPASFYQMASHSEEPQAMINLAIEKRSENPRYPASAFSSLVKGNAEKEPMGKGVYLLVRVEDSVETLKEQAITNGDGYLELYGKTRLHSIGGSFYMEIK
jgi:hypothetical protein